MAEKPDIKRLIAFQKLLLDFRAIERHSHLPNNLEERENDVDHSYSLAMCAWFLASSFPELDRDKVIRLAMVHDLLEVHAGDTFVYGDQARLDDKKEREEKAAAQIAQEWPDFPDMIDGIAEYEMRQSPEAKFVYALDKLLPSFLNYLSQGYVWKKHGITFEKFQAEKAKKVAVSPEINNYYQQLVSLLGEHPDFFPASD